MELPPHIVVFPFPAQGHVNPAFQFSHHLASRGLCFITFLNTHRYISKLQGNARPSRIRLLSVPLKLSEEEALSTDIPRLAAATEKMGGALEEILVRLLDADTGKAQGEDRWSPPVCIVTDVFFGWAQDVADKLKLPRFILFTPPAATLMVMLHVPDMVSKGRLPYTKRRSSAEGEEERVDLLNLPGVTPKVRLSDIPSHLILDPSTFMYGYFIRNCRRIPDAAGLLLNTFYELEAPAIDAARAFLHWTPPALLQSQVRAEIVVPQMLHRVLPVGPLLPSDFFERSSRSNIIRTPASENERCLQWLDRHSPSSTIYVSFGSIAVLSDAQINELALGLEASGQPFLWVVRPQNPSATHEDVLPCDFLSRTTGQGLVVSWAPQLDILSHSSTAFFLSHCGWNSTLESICSGVALLCWPMFAEQKMNCRFLVDEVKVGLEFCGANHDGMVVPREEVERVVRIAIETEEGNAMKRRVRELRDVAKRVVTEGGSSFENLLQDFVQLVSSL